MMCVNLIIMTPHLRGVKCRVHSKFIPNQTSLQQFIEHEHQLCVKHDWGYRLQTQQVSLWHYTASVELQLFKVRMSQNLKLSQRMHLGQRPVRWQEGWKCKDASARVTLLHGLPDFGRTWPFFLLTGFVKRPMPDAEVAGFSCTTKASARYLASGLCGATQQWDSMTNWYQINTIFHRISQIHSVHIWLR